MKRLLKILRLSSLAFMIILASMGLAITGAAPVLSNKRGEYINREIRTEMPKENEADKSQEEEIFIN